MVVAFLSLNAFVKTPKEIANGGGFTSSGSYFNFTVVENKGSVTGHLAWYGTTYEVECLYIKAIQLPFIFPMARPSM